MQESTTTALKSTTSKNEIDDPNIESTTSKYSRRLQYQVDHLKNEVDDYCIEVDHLKNEVDDYCIEVDHLKIQSTTTELKSTTSKYSRRLQPWVNHLFT